MENLINNFHRLSSVEIFGIACFMAILAGTVFFIIKYCIQQSLPWVLVLLRFIGLMFYVVFIRKEKGSSKIIQNRFKSEIEQEELEADVKYFKSDAIPSFTLFFALVLTYYFAPALAEVFNL